MRHSLYLFPLDDMSDDQRQFGTPLAFKLVSARGVRQANSFQLKKSTLGANPLLVRTLQNNSTN